MSELPPDLIDQVLAACQANASDVAATLSSTLGVDLTLGIGGPEKFATETLPNGPGLAVLFNFAEVGFVAILNESSGLIPTWYENPDPTGQSKLSTLAQELSMQVLPDLLAADKFQAARVEDLRIAIERAGIAEGAVLLPLDLKTAETTAQLLLIWPLSAPGNLFDQVKQTDISPSAQMPNPSRPQALRLGELPSYTRSLLKITVPVRVVLADKKESVEDVVELAAGTIIKFSKSCEEVLHLYVGDQQVAEGEAVKVGDKFGFRVTQMTLPEEHFLKIKPNRAG